MGTGVESTVRQKGISLLWKYLVPFGWVVLLTSMFIAGDRNRVHQLFYVFLAIPTFALVVLQPSLIKRLVSNPLFLCFVVFALYMIVTVAWSSTDETALSLIRRPLYIALLMFAAGLIGMDSVDKLNRLTLFSASVAAVAAAISLVYFWKILIPNTGMRLDGYGALYNPLLSAHVFGAFATFWLSTWLQGRSLVNPKAIICFVVLGVTLLATGSRTPLVGLAAALVWLVATGDKRRGALIAAIIVAGMAVLLFVEPQIVTQRGVSYRPEIWAEALRQISQRPWLGYGYDSNMVVKIPTLEDPLADPHNMELGVLYAGGVIGLALWIALYVIAFKFCWQNRTVPAIALAGAWLAFGLGSGMSEGMAFMSRPKEHWFLIWIPMALIYGQWLALRFKARLVSHHAAEP